MTRDEATARFQSAFMAGPNSKADTGSYYWSCGMVLALEALGLIAFEEPEIAEKKIHREAAEYLKGVTLSNSAAIDILLQAGFKITR